jgi:hypothetical protein
MTNALVLRFSHLVKLKHADKAKAMLEKVASLVRSAGPAAHDLEAD